MSYRINPVTSPMSKTVIRVVQPFTPGECEAQTEPGRSRNSSDTPQTKGQLLLRFIRLVINTLMNPSNSLTKIIAVTVFVCILVFVIGWVFHSSHHTGTSCSRLSIFASKCGVVDYFNISNEWMLEPHTDIASASTNNTTAATEMFLKPRTDNTTTSTENFLEPPTTEDNTTSYPTAKHTPSIFSSMKKCISCSNNKLCCRIGTLTQRQYKICEDGDSCMFHFRTKIHNCLKKSSPQCEQMNLCDVQFAMPYGCCCGRNPEKSDLACNEIENFTPMSLKLYQ